MTQDYWPNSPFEHALMARLDQLEAELSALRLRQQELSAHVEQSLWAAEWAARGLEAVGTWGKKVISRALETAGWGAIIWLATKVHFG